ncbi:hypothetical protein GCM10009747_01160 [Agromyces humatus]|uniref:Uncharacterized protein n=1 Tax=Agromyces humatus TaxID=279573 RepID=A0ABN2K4D5_9MICO
MQGELVARQEPTEREHRVRDDEERASHRDDPAAPARQRGHGAEHRAVHCDGHEQHREVRTEQREEGDVPRGRAVMSCHLLESNDDRLRDGRVAADRGARE